MSEYPASDQVQQWPSAVEYDLSIPPSIVSQVGIDDLVEPSKFGGNLYRSVQWSPDGAVALALTEDRTLRLYGLPEVLEPTTSKSEFILVEAVTPADVPDPWKLLRTFPQPDAIHSFAWYPHATVAQPATFCFLVAVRDSPIRLIDAMDGRIRATYSIVDHRERFIAPLSLAFSPDDALRFYCGFESAIEVFEVSSPGNEMGERLKTRRVRQSKNGQRGIISSLAFARDGKGAYAAGTFDGSVSVYSEDMGGTAHAHLEGVEKGGVTQMAYHPRYPSLLYIASRRSETLELHDTDNASFGPIVKLPRAALTNQRLGFAIEPWGRWLACGDIHGMIHVYDIASPGITVPTLSFKAHDDVVSAVHFHPTLPMLISCSGSRVFPDANDDSSDSESESDSDSDSEASFRLATVTVPKPADASLKLWRFAVIDSQLAVSSALPPVDPLEPSELAPRIPSVSVDA